MKTDQLIYFLETARTQHVGRAAKTLNISPSAISHSIAALEAELGESLFEKTGKNISLTVKGKRLAFRTEELLNLLQDIKEEIASPEIPYEGRFRVGVTHGLLHHWIVPIWSAMSTRFAKVEIEFYSLRSASVVEQVSDGQLDLGICFAPTPNPNIIQTLLRVESLHLAVNRKHSLLRAYPKGRGFIDKLVKYPSVSPKAFFGVEVCEDHPMLRQIGITSRPSVYFDSYDVGAQLVAQGDCWSLLPQSFIEWYGLKALAIPGFCFETKIVAATPKGRRLPTSLRDFIGQLTMGESGVSNKT